MDLKDLLKAHIYERAEYLDSLNEEELNVLFNKLEVLRALRLEKSPAIPIDTVDPSDIPWV
jgi:hypothetical protein